MQHQEVKPPEALRDVIKCFWHTNRDFGELPSVFEIVPVGCAEIVFLFGSPCRISTPEGWLALPSPFLMGLRNQSVLLSAQNQLEIIGIRCFPWTVFELLGRPARRAPWFGKPVYQLQTTARL